MKIKITTTNQGKIENVLKTRISRSVTFGDITAAVETAERLLVQCLPKKYWTGTMLLLRGGAGEKFPRAYQNKSPCVNYQFVVVLRTSTGWFLVRNVIDRAWTSRGIPDSTVDVPEEHKQAAMKQFFGQASVL